MPEPLTQERFFTAPLAIILMTVFIDLIGFGMVIPILPFYAVMFQATPLEIGFLQSIYSWMQFFFAPVLGRLSDRFGRRPVLLFSLLGSAAGYFVLGLAETLSIVFVGRVVSGITGASISTAQAYIADVTSRENRAKGMGLFGATFGLGFILGPAMAGVLSKFGVHVPFYFAAVLSLVNAVALYFFLPETVKKGVGETIIQTRPMNRFAALFDSLREREFRVVNLLYFLLITAFSIMTYAFVLFTAHRYGYNAEQNGYLFTFVGVISVIGQGLLFGRLVRRFGEATLTSIGCSLMVVSLFAFPFLGPQFGGLWLLLATCAVLSIGNSFASPSLTSLGSKISSEERQGSSLGIMQSGASLARAVGPMLGGFLLNNAVNEIDDVTIARTFWTASGVMLVALFMAIYTVGVLRGHHASAAANR